MRLLCLILTIGYALVSLFFAIRSFRRKPTRMAVFAIVTSACLPLTLMIPDPVAARSLLTLLLVLLASLELISDLRRGPAPHWPIHLIRLAVSLAIIMSAVMSQR